MPCIHVLSYNIHVLNRKHGCDLVFITAHAEEDVGLEDIDGVDERHARCYRKPRVFYATAQSESHSPI
jgi:hypothetical protein